MGQTVTEVNDKEQLLPTVEVIERQSGRRPEEILADSGYCSEKNLEGLESADQPEQRIEGYIATERQKHDEYREACPKRPLPKGATRVDRMRAEAENQSGKSRVRGAQGDSRTAARTDQASAWVPAVSVAGHRQGAWRVGTGVPERITS